jgi:D-lactate dehydrogenase (cytochrome)
MNPVLAAFRSALPALAMTTDADSCAVLSSDIAAPAAQPAAVVLQPATPDQVAHIVRVARREGIALHPRGGGWSYTGGYTPADRPAAMVDARLLHGITIDRDAAAATAGAGTSWADLHTALEAQGLRAASFGPLSGIGATVGGSAAQNGGFFGAAGHGAMGDGGIQGGTMVLGTGEPYSLSLADRAEGQAAPQPLVGDCGAFGIRTDVTIRTIPAPAATRFSSFDFASGEAALSVLISLVGRPNFGEAYIFDPGTHRNLARSGFSVIESAGLAGDLLGGRGSLLGRIGSLVRTARAGKAFVADLSWSLHLSFDGTAAEIAAAASDAMHIAHAAGGEIVPDVIPRVTRARPFRRIKALLGPDGEAWLPVHGVFAPSQAQPALAAVERALTEADATMQQHQVRVAILMVMMGARIIIEPQLFWPDALSPVLRRMAQPEQVARFGDRPANATARRVAHDLRRRLIDVLDKASASHFQIGRSYAGHPGVPVAARQVWATLKQRFDPDHIMNPGALGL